MNSKVVFAVLLFCPLSGAHATALPLPGATTSFTLTDPGTESPIHYERYGVFENTGTPKYRYVIKDRAGLAAAAGLGVYPNTAAGSSATFKELSNTTRLDGSVWDFVNSDDMEAQFYKWATNQDQPAGLREFYIAQILQKTGHYAQAIKAYYAVAVNFPTTIGLTFWKTPWYPAVASLDLVAWLTREHPELGMRLEGARGRIDNRFDDDTHNDVFKINPGRLISVSTAAVTSERAIPARMDLERLAIKRQLGKGRVHIVQYSNDHWQLIVDSAPYIVRAIAYHATKIGKSPDNGTLEVHKDWMTSDDNKNGKLDGPYDSWVDENRNNKQDADEPVVGDFKLLKDMGVNTVRLYHHGWNKNALMDLYKNYGIRVIMGDYAGAYAMGSGAEWLQGTDYSNPVQQDSMLASIKSMVEEYKEEPYIVFWVLGNENNYANANNANKNPEAYYKFLNRAALYIKSLDANHPVALCNGDTLFLDKAAAFAPDVDIYGANAYRGEHGFGDSFWQDIADIWKKPAFITEYGCPAYHHRRSVEEAERLQAEYHRGNWNDIERNTAGGPGVGNALGGSAFEWMDEWWKAGPPPQYDPAIQDITGQFGGPFPDGWSYEEWYGLTDQGNGSHSPYMRQLRKAYFLYKDELWNSQKWTERGLPKC
jgi:hypothetical protein